MERFFLFRPAGIVIFSGPALLARLWLARLWRGSGAVLARLWPGALARIDAGSGAVLVRLWPGAGPVLARLWPGAGPYFWQRAPRKSGRVRPCYHS